MNYTVVKKFTAGFIFLVVIAVVVAGCLREEHADLVPGNPNNETAIYNNWYSIYFTDPDSPTARTYRGGPDAALADAIDQARLSVDVAVHDLNLWSVRNALIDAHQRGVSVRVVTESDNLDRTELQARSLF